MLITLEDIGFNQKGDDGAPRVSTTQVALPPPAEPNQFEDELENLDAIMPIVKSKANTASVLTQPNRTPNRDSEPVTSSHNQSTFSKNMQTFAKMPQSMGQDDQRKGPYDAASEAAQRHSNAPSGNFSQEMSQAMQD